MNNMFKVAVKRLGKPMQYFQTPETMDNRTGLTYDIKKAWRFDTFSGAMKIAKGYEDSCVLSGNWA